MCIVSSLHYWVTQAGAAKGAVVGAEGAAESSKPLCGKELFVFYGMYVVLIIIFFYFIFTFSCFYRHL